MKNKGYVEKTWGYEIVWENNEKYSAKILCFSQPGNKTSFHFHKNKEESWFINSGQFFLRFIDLKTGELKERIIKEGETWKIEPLVPHQLEAISVNSVIFEAGTEDDLEDVYRVIPK